MDIKKLTKFIAIILIICAVLIALIWYIFSENTQLRDGLIAEIVGGGILGSIVAAVFFYLQESDEQTTNQKKAQSFYNDKLVLDMREAFDRNPSPWNFSGLNKFYYDNSRINSLFDIYQANFSDINEYDAYFPENELIVVFKEFYRETRKAYVLGEKLEGELYQLVRREHHRRQIADINDFSARAYVKGILFAEMPDGEILKYLDLQNIPDYNPQIIEASKNSEQVMSLIGEIKQIRDSLIQKEKKIEKLVTKEN